MTALDLTPLDNTLAGLPSDTERATVLDQLLDALPVRPDDVNLTAIRQGITDRRTALDA